MIFIEAIRTYAEAQPEALRNWLVGLDPQVGRALRALHGDPCRAWTLPELARVADASRTTFAERFSDRVGIPAMAVLSAWRMQIAANPLSSAAATVAQIGYESNASAGPSNAEPGLRAANGVIQGEANRPTWRACHCDASKLLSPIEDADDGLKFAVP